MWTQLTCSRTADLGIYAALLSTNHAQASPMSTTYTSKPTYNARQQCEAAAMLRQQPLTMSYYLRRPVAKKRVMSIHIPAMNKVTPALLNNTDITKPTNDDALSMQRQQPYIQAANSYQVTRTA